MLVLVFFKWSNYESFECHCLICICIHYRYSTMPYIILIQRSAVNPYTESLYVAVIKRN